MIITALMENKAKEGLCYEHGLAVHIQYHNKNYLLDTGASDKFINNAKKLGIKLEAVDAAILSHAHYDHSGGYHGFFSCNEKAKAYIREEGRDKYYTRIIGPVMKNIGIPKGVLGRYSERIIYVSDSMGSKPMQIEKGVNLLGFTAAKKTGVLKKASMYHRGKDGLIPDAFKHEQSLILEAKEGIVIFNSCCHHGVCNVVEMAKKAFPDKRILAVIGGFHLMGRGGVKTMSGSREKIEYIAKRLDEMGVEHVYTGHCTGDPAFRILKEKLGEKCSYFMAGTVIEIP